MRRHFVVFVSKALAGSLLLSAFAAPALAQWPQWGGKNMDFKADATGLADRWPESGPKELWRRNLGDGYSSILVDHGRLYTMYRSADDAKEIVVAIDAATGKSIWEHGYVAAPSEKHRNEFGRGPRATPLIVGDRIFSIGVSGKLHCLNKEDGKPYWSQDLWKQFGGTVLSHGYSSSPIAYKNTVIVLSGGQGASLIAFNQSDGHVIWKKQDFDNGYSTPILIELSGKPQLVTFMDERVVGINPDTGSLEWDYEFKGTNMAQPVWDDEAGMLFISAMGVGARGLKLTRNGNKTNVEESWKTRKIQFFHVNPIAVGDYVYGSSGSSPCFFSCINRKTGKIAWRKRGFARATAVFADGKFILLDENGKLALTRATPDEFEVLSQVPLIEKVAWTVPTVVGNKMYIRDLKTIRAIELN